MKLKGVFAGPSSARARNVDVAAGIDALRYCSAEAAFPRWAGVPHCSPAILMGSLEFLVGFDPLPGTRLGFPLRIGLIVFPQCPGKPLDQNKSFIVPARRPARRS